MARGIERVRLRPTETDREDFVSRPPSVSQEAAVRRGRGDPVPGGDDVRGEPIGSIGGTL